MRRYLAAILFLTVVATAYAKDIRQSMAEKTKTTVTSNAVSYILASYSSATGWDVRRMADDSVLKLGGMDTTAADGARHFECNNSGAMNTAGLTSANAGRFCFDQSLQKFRYWTGTNLADMGGGASTIAQLTDWPQPVTATEVGYLDGVTSGIQGQLDALTTGNSGYVAPPTYSDDPCSLGQWSADSGYHYVCKASNAWDRIAFSNWSSPAPIQPPAAPADYIYPLADNAASDSVAQVGGVVGTATARTSSGFTSVYHTATPAFAMTSAQYVNVALAPSTTGTTSGVNAPTSTWAMEVEIRWQGNSFGNSTLMGTSNNAFSLKIVSATQMQLYSNAASLGTFDVPSIAADQVTWTLVRVVYDGAAMPKNYKVYTKSGDEPWGLRFTSETAMVDTRHWGTGSKFYGWGTSVGNEFRNLKVWNSAAVPQ